MVRVRYVGTVRFKNWTEYDTLVRYSSRCEVCSTQILNVPYRTAILACHTEIFWFYYLIISYILIISEKQNQMIGLFENECISYEKSKKLHCLTRCVALRFENLLTSSRYFSELKDLSLDGLAM